MSKLRDFILFAILDINYFCEQNQFNILNKRLSSLFKPL